MCKVIFAGASFHHSSVQFLRLAGVVILVSSLSCPIVVLRFRSISHCLKQFCDGVQLSCFFTVNVDPGADCS